MWPVTPEVADLSPVSLAIFPAFQQSLSSQVTLAWTALAGAFEGVVGSKLVPPPLKARGLGGTCPTARCAALFSRKMSWWRRGAFRLACYAALRYALKDGDRPPCEAWRDNLKSEAMPSLISDYIPLVVFIIIAALISGALMIAPFLVAYRAPDTEKLSPYECGFPPFDDARMRFDARFYLVSLLFIIFDLEVAFLFPWAIVFHDLGALGFWSMMIFLAVLTIGFVYEWNKGALEWD